MSLVTLGENDQLGILAAYCSSDAPASDRQMAAKGNLATDAMLTAPGVSGSGAQVS
jgi:hypothetical protein